MLSEEKHKINCWIPESLWKQIESLGYDSPTKATIEAFEALVIKDGPGSFQEALGNAQEELRKLQEEIGSYQEKIKDLEKRPDPVNFAQLQARNEGLQLLLEEKDKRINELNREVGNLATFAHAFKSPEYKWIKAPGEEVVTAGGEVVTPKKERPSVKALEITCLNCGNSFAAERKTRKFCSNKCKMAYYRKK